MLKMLLWPCCVVVLSALVINNLGYLGDKPAQFNLQMQNDEGAVLDFAERDIERYLRDMIVYERYERMLFEQVYAQRKLRGEISYGGGSL